jgi:hypothetical protein
MRAAIAQMVSSALQYAAAPEIVEDLAFALRQAQGERGLTYMSVRAELVEA